ncbi:MAG: TlpA disulfide reductase family protein [Thermodesulfobacteriota bacterium]
MAAVLLLASLAGCGEEKIPPIRIGDPAPEFQATDLAGAGFSLAAKRGQPVILRFFLPDCKFCKADTAVFSDYFSRYHAQGLEIVYINTAGSDDELRTFVEQLKIPFPVINDSDGRLAAKYRVQAVPQTIVLDPDHLLRAAILGGVSAEELDAILGTFFQ